MKRAVGYSELEDLHDAEALARLLRSPNELPKPTVVRVHGSAYGGGLIAACDISLGVFEAQFSLSEVRLGPIPAVIGPYFIAAIGACRMALLHEIAADEAALDEAVGEPVDTLLSGGPSAQAECKRLTAAVAGRPIDDDTARRITRILAGADANEGMAAFLEKRHPAWRWGKADPAGD
jgi:methylglutaconyl-CoA hydratase